MGKKSYKRELIEWGVIVLVGVTLYATGWHTEVLGQLQRVVLATGIVTPDLDEPAVPARYDFELTRADGRQVSFQEFEGKTVFLNFWATWCPPCIAEMPDIEDLYEKTGDKVAFVMISLDEDPEKAKQFIQRKDLDLPVYFLASQLPSVYNPRSIPTTYVLSPEGRIEMTRHGMAKYDTKQFREFLLGLGEN